MTSSIGSVTSAWPASSTQTNPMSTARSDVMTAVAKELGVTSSQLQTQLSSGQSLSQLASAAGISSDQLNATITSALQQSGLPAGTDVSALASRMANHVGGHHHHHGSGSSTDPTALTDPTSSTDSTSGTSVSVYA
jgi:hypothetical protein